MLPSWLLGETGVVCLCLSVASYAAPGRQALVIGNANYAGERGKHRLDNPGNDAAAIATALRGLGFDEAKPLLDLKREDLRKAIDEFRKRIQAGGVAVFYYSGH